MNITWDEERYENNFSFVHHYGEAVLDLIDAESAVQPDRSAQNGSTVQSDTSDVPKKPYSLKPITKPLASQQAKEPVGKSSDPAAKAPRFRDITEDDDGYHPYADVPDMRPLFERDPWY